MLDESALRAPIVGTRLPGGLRRIKADRLWKEARQWAQTQGLEHNNYVAGGLPL